MQKAFIRILILSIFFAPAPALAGMSMSCDMGDISINSRDIEFENGQFQIKGDFSISARGNSYLQYIQPDNGGGSNRLEWTWNGADKNILHTKLGEIILTPITGAPRMDIVFPQPDYYENGKAVINHHKIVKQQGCILK